MLQLKGTFLYVFFVHSPIMPQYLCLVCNQCPANGRPCLYCAGCKEPWHCSADCQQLHWKYDSAIMPGWRAHRKECWFVAVRDILCEFLADSLALLILQWANRFGPVKVSLRTKTKMAAVRSRFLDMG